MRSGLRRSLWVAAMLVVATGALSAVPAAPLSAAESEVKRPALPLRPDRAPPKPQEKIRRTSESGRFALTYPTPEWFVVPDDRDEQDQRYDLTLRHRDGASFIRAHRGRRNNRGIEGSLIQESKQAKYLIDYEPETVAPEISTEDYEASALFCGRRRQGPARRACSLVKVVLHGREVIQIHSLIDADTPRARKRLQSEVEAIVDSLELIEPDETEANGPPPAL